MNSNGVLSMDLVTTTSGKCDEYWHYLIHLIRAVIHILFQITHRLNCFLSCDWHSGMGTHMLESILQTRCMAMGFINLQMGIVMKAHGMMEGNKV